MQTLPTTDQVRARLREAGLDTARAVRVAMEATGDPDCLVAQSTIGKVFGATPGEAVLHESSLAKFQRFFELSDSRSR